MAQQSLENETVDVEYKNKMLHLAGMMQYEDDYDDTNYQVGRKANRPESSDSEDEKEKKP